MIPRAACLALLGCLTLSFPAAPQERSLVGPGDAQPELGAEIPHCFTMLPPGKAWRQLDLGELRSLDSEAQVGLAGPHGVRAVLSAQTSDRIDLAACVIDLLEEQQLEQVKRVFEEDTRVEGRQAAHALVTGRRDGTWWRYHATAFRDGSELYLLLSWGRSDDVPADGSTFLEAAQGLKRIAGVGLEELSRADTALDADGPGWRVRAGVYRDAALGFALAPRGAWRVASARELAPLGPEVQAGLIDVLHDALFGVVAERVPGVNADEYADACRRRAQSQGHQAGSRSEKVAERELELRLITLPGPSGYADETVRSVFGVFFEGERCFQVLARYPAVQERSMVRSLPQALASLELLNEEQGRQLVDELRREPIPFEAVGEGWSLRGGVFSDFRNGFRWHLPEGYWTVVAGERGDPESDAPTLALQERALGVHGWIRVDEGDIYDGAEGHARALAQLTAGLARSVVHGTESVRLGALEGRISSLDLKDPVRPQRALLASAGDGLRGFRICFSAPAATLEHHAEQVAAAITALQISVEPIAPTEMSAGRYRDARMGFELDAPAPDWLFRERKLDRFGPSAEAAQGVIVSFEEPAGGRLHASAAWIAGGPGSLDQALSALLPTALQSALRLPDAAPIRDQSAAFRGLPCRLLAWQDGERRIELVLLARQHTAYAVAVEATGQRAELSDWLAGFRLLD